LQGHLALSDGVRFNLLMFIQLLIYPEIGAGSGDYDVKIKKLLVRVRSL